MTRFRNFIARPFAERRLWVMALMQLVRFRVLLSVGSFERLRNDHTRPIGSAVVSVDQVRWAVLSSSRFVPASTCLVRALAARRLLAQAGLPAALHVGVGRRGEGIDAHAWVDSRGELVVGDHLPGRFRELPMKDS